MTTFPSTATPEGRRVYFRDYSHNLLAAGMSVANVARMIGVSSSTMAAVKNRVSWKHMLQ